MTRAERYNRKMERIFSDAKRLKAERDGASVAAFHAALPRNGWPDLSESQQGTLLHLASQILEESRGRSYNPRGNE